MVLKATEAFSGRCGLTPKTLAATTGSLLKNHNARPRAMKETRATIHQTENFGISNFGSSKGEEGSVELALREGGATDGRGSDEDRFVLDLDGSERCAV
jgi:hypothetical protein